MNSKFDIKPKLILCNINCIKSVNKNSEEWNLYISKLNKNNITRINKFIFDDDKKRNLISILLQNYLIRKLLNVNNNDSFEILRSKYNKPYLSTNNLDIKNWNFNVSHDGDYVVIGSHISNLIGIDIININKKNMDKNFELLKNKLNNNELNNLIKFNNDDKYFLFLLIWSLKESYIKAIGKGLYYDLSKLDFKFNNLNLSNINNNFNISLYINNKIKNDWKFYFKKIDKNHILTIALGPLNEINDDKLDNYKYNLPELVIKNVDSLLK